MSNEKISSDVLPNDPYTGSCKDCNDTIDMDEYLAHNGCCHRCNPKKLKNIDAALREVGIFYYRQTAKEILRRIIKEDNPSTVEDLRDLFWFQLANDKNLSHKKKDFSDVIDSVIQEMIDSGIIQDKAA